MQLVHLLIGFQGRIGRGQFWLGMLIWGVIYGVVVVAAALLTSSLDAMLGVGLIAYLLTVILTIPIAVKRLHDRNKPGWWLLVFYGIPFALQFGVALFIDIDAETTPTSLSILQYLGLAVALWGLIELGFIRGTIGANPHGPDPVAPKPAKH